MRLLFEKGRQKELLNKEKNARNLSWPKFAEQLDLNESKLKPFYYDGVLIDDITFNKLHLKKNYEKFIIKKLDENWGRVKGGKNSPGSLKEIKIPKKNEELAEFWGILLGDGNIQRIQSYKVGVYKVTVSGDSRYDKDYLMNFVKPLGEKLFDIKSGVLQHKSRNELNIIFYGRKIVDFFEAEGFMAGDKIKNQVGIPSWIKQNNKFLSACLRGLHDTDGCFYKLTNQNSYQIGFTNHNFRLLNDVREGLLDLGIGVSKIMNNRRIVITKKQEIAKFYKLVGFHNSKHLNKIKAYFKAL